MGKAVRLDKFLADAGAGTRSEVKKYIQKGKVQVNGVPVKKPEIKVSEEDESNSGWKQNFQGIGICLLSSAQTCRLCQCDRG